MKLVIDGIRRAVGSRRAILVVAATSVVACMSAETKVLGPNTLASTTPDSTRQTQFLSVAPQSATIAVGANVQLSSTLTDTLGNAITGQTVNWSSSNSAVASVDGTGLVVGLTAGSAAVTASSVGLQASANITVDPVAVASVAVSPRTDTLPVGQGVQLLATPKDASGNTLTGRVVTWSSSNAAVATVSGSGAVNGIAAGVVTISATCEGVVGTASITVMVIPVASVAVTPALDTVPLGGTFRFTATPKDAGGNPLTGRVVTWATGNSSIATVTGNGTVTGVAVGSTSVAATSEGQNGSATVVVIMVPVASVTVSPASGSVQTAATKQFSATTRDANGNVLTGRTITWGSNNTGVATVNGSGLATGVAAGSATITATSEGKSGTAALTVTNAPPTLVRITMTPDTATINVGATKQFSVTGKYSDSSTAPVTATFTAAGGTITSGGLYTAGQTAGSYSVIATVQTFKDTSTVTVFKPPVASVVVTPALDTLAVGQTQQLTAVTKDAGGNVLTGRIITWASSNTAALSVNGSGLVSALATGSATLTATSEGVNGTSSMYAVVVLAATVQVTPASSAVQVGTTAQLTATARDANGNILTGHAVTWTSLNTAVATVNGSGMVSGANVGNVTIQALVDTAKGSGSVRVDSAATAATPWVLEDFSTYTSTANMLADPRGIYSVGEDLTTGQMVLDQSVGYGSSKQSMRYDFPDRTGTGGSGTSGRCTDYTIGRNMTLPSTVTELWVEVAARYQSTWTTLAPSSWGCTSNSDYKFFMARVNGTGRFMLFAGTYGTGWQFGYPGNDEGAGSDTPGYYGNATYPFSITGSPWDGNWHVYRFHYRVGTGGAAEWWYDGVKMPSFENVDASAGTSIYGLGLGRNLNQGPGQPQSIWWGRIVVYKSNPGW